MNSSVGSIGTQSVDSIQQRLTDYACNLTYESLSPAAILAAKARIIDTLGALLGGFDGEPCSIVRNLAIRLQRGSGATIIGTAMKTDPEMAAFVNSTTARYVEINDSFHLPGGFGGHPSDALMSVLATAEYVQASGRDFITAAILAYEVHMRIAEAADICPRFDHTNYVCLGVAVAAGKLLKLTPVQLAHCIAMTVISNNTLFSVRTGHLSMFKAVVSGQVGRSGIFAALLAQAGIEGPHLPFEGKGGWCDLIAGKKVELGPMGGNDTPFKVQETLIKPRPTCGTTQTSILAAEKVAPYKSIKNIKRVTVEAYKEAIDVCGSGKHHWAPNSRETADHSIPYVVAISLIYGTVTHRHFDDAYLWNPEVRALMQKIEVVENPEFTRAYQHDPVDHRGRATVVSNSGESLMGESSEEDFIKQKDPEQIEDKFRKLTKGVLSPAQTDAVLDRTWHLENIANVTDIPSALVLER